MLELMRFLPIRKPKILWIVLVVHWWIMNFNECQNGWVSFPLNKIKISSIYGCALMNYELQWMLEWMSFATIGHSNHPVVWIYCWWIMGSNECLNGWAWFPLEILIHWTCMVVYGWIASSNECWNGWDFSFTNNLIHWTHMIVHWWITSFEECSAGWILFPLETLIHS
jgi:hypothetical protein